ncbi:MAG: sulfotransferase domain-containing protein [Actinobacteria bacterium]|nr:MAG: sulfotransferase domain-containing protein [Actinomycetota bacterium]
MGSSQTALPGPAGRGRRRGRLRRGARAVRLLPRRITASGRVLPDFVVIGAQKAGTSTLYARVAAHPLVVPALRKEVHYFDFHWDAGTGWYRAHFPTAVHCRRRERRRGARPITGEASPYYLFHPDVPERVRQTIPDVRLIALLRDPVDRAISEYHHAVRLEFEERPIETALDPDHAIEAPARGATEWFDRPDGDARRRSYLARGRYAEQLPRWWRVFPREQLLVLETAELRTEAAMPRVFEFLGLPGGMAAAAVPDRNVHAYPEASESVIERLARYYEPYNAQLWDMLGCQWEWR